MIAIRPRSGRTFFDALHRAELPYPTSLEQIGDLYLQLLLSDIDHEAIGSGVWLTRILGSALDHVESFDLDDGGEG
jgi:hypothetical protein